MHLHLHFLYEGLHKLHINHTHVLEQHPFITSNAQQARGWHDVEI